MGAIASSLVAGQAFADPMQFGDAGRLIVTATVNDAGPLELIVDTGASNTCLSETAASQLDLPHERTVRITSPQGPREAPVVRIVSLRTPGIAARDLTAIVLPDALMRGHDGLLGVDAFKDGKLTLNFDAREVSLNASGPTPGLASVQGSVGGNGILFVRLPVGEGEALAMVDTGASEVFVNRPFLRLAGAAEGDAIYLRVGERTLRTRALVSPMANWGDQPGVLLGMSALHEFGIAALDFPMARLHIPTA